MANMKLLIFIIVIALTFSCTNDIEHPPKIEKLMSRMEDANQKKFNKLFSKYSKPENDLKLKAAYYLLEHMGNKYTAHYSNIEHFYKLLDHMHSFNPLSLSIDSCDKIGDTWVEKHGKEFGQLEVKYDIDELTYTMLKENIDYAFKAWKEMPWAKHVDFNEFCEYILPYRAYNEPLSQWRKYYYNKFSWLKDSIGNITDPVEACTKVNEYLADNRFKFVNALAKFPYINAVDQDKYRAGHCEPRTMWVLFAMRSIGLPVAIDFTPSYTRKPLSHTWMAVLDSNNSSVAFNGAGFGDETDESYIVPTDTRAVAKAYRNTYKIQNGITNKNIKAQDVFGYFSRQNYKDVSDEYKYPRADYVFELDKNKFGQLQGQPLYLCNFGYGGHYIPVDISPANGLKYQWNNIACEAIYVVTAAHNGRYYPANNPVTFDTKTKEVIMLKPDYTKITHAKITRKYTPSQDMRKFADNMVNGRIEGANKADFSDAVNLKTITKDEIVYHYADQKIGNNKKFRFYRYAPDKTTTHLAELEFFNTLRGNTISSIYNPGKLKENSTYYWRIDEKYINKTIEGKVWSFKTGILDKDTISPKITYSASSSFAGNEGPSAVSDGIIGLQDIGEWISNSEMKPWIALEFSKEIEINKIILYDRNNMHDHLTGGLITFSDGSILEASDIPNDGSAFELNFNAKTITSLKFEVKESEGTNIGISEIEIFYTDGTPVVKHEEEFFPYVDRFPFPEDISTNNLVNTKICWKPNSEIESYDIYFGTTNPPPFVCNQKISPIGKAEQTELKNAYDGDIRTNCNLALNSWIGIDLGPGNRQIINKIRYMVRNNFNIIEVGDKYELLFFDNGWRSLGIVIAKNNYLYYPQVPANCLLWLHNHSRGKKERIFTIENGKQIWW